jgi:hypothetical protein
MAYSAIVETKLSRAISMTRKDKKQRWVTMDGVIHELAVPYRDAISVYWVQAVECVTFNFRHRRLAHSATEALCW